jgi:hypothetical protein
MLADYTKLATWHDVLDPDFPLICSDGKLHSTGYLCNWLLKRGLTKRGWQVYFFAGDPLLDALGEPWTEPEHPEQNIQHTIAFLNLIAACDMRVQMLPPRALVASMAKWNIPEGRLDVIPPNFFRSLWEACMAAEYKQPRNQVALAHFIKKVALPIAHWYFSTGEHLKPDANKHLSLAGWLTLRGDYARWQNNQKREKEERKPAPAQWQPFIGTFEHGGLRFVALVSQTALEVEGDVMRHCIAEHWNRIRSEVLVRAYSIRDRESGSRVATITVKETVPGHWNIDDLQGPRNRPVPDHVRQAGIALLRAYEDAYYHQPAMRAGIDESRMQLVPAVVS